MQFNSPSPAPAFSPPIKKEEEEEEEPPRASIGQVMAEPTLTSVSISVAYNRPPAPPSARPLPRHVYCFLCLFNLFCALLKLVIFLIIALAVSQLILWLIFQPNELKAHLEDATLTQFNLSTTATNTNSSNLLIYNLSFNFSVRNPNRRVGIYYDSVEAFAIYHDTRFGFQTLPSFYQGHKSTAMLRLVFAGQGFMLADDTPARYAAEKAEGFYNIELKVHASVRFKAGIIQTDHIKPKFNCRVRLPAHVVAGNSKPPDFERTKCDVDY